VAGRGPDDASVGLTDRSGTVLVAAQTNATPYRADIDGLRALSILLVVGYHAEPWLAPGGFIGVDIFFVISGFLITGIILTELEAGSFSPLKFYARRVRRIFPALIVVLLATYLIGWFVLLPDGFSLLGENITAGVAFVSNLFQLRHAGYFAPDSSENPLLHLWSLGIEEQFYIFWPPALLLMANSERRRRWIAGLTLLSFGVSLLIFFGYKEWSFYSPLPRAWELLAGGILADRLRSHPEGLKKAFARYPDLQALTGVALIAGATFGLSSDSLFPGLYALLPTLGAVLIIVSPLSWINRIVLSSPPMVLLGLISYPLYLWHWPLLVYLSILRNGTPNFLEIWLAVIVAVMLSWLTFRLVEKPLRRSKDVVPKLAFGLVALGVVGIATAAGSGFDFRFAPEIREIAKLAPQNNSGLRDLCFMETPGAKFSSDCIEPGDQPLLFLWGDSTAATLYPGLKKAEERFPFRLARFAAPGCAPILANRSRPACDANNDLAFGFLTSSHPDIVLLQAMWDQTPDLDHLADTILKLKALNVPHIVILGPMPVWKRTLPHSLVNYYRFRHVIADRIATGMSGPQGDQRMQAIAKASGVEYISARQVLCNAEGCLTRVGPTADDVVVTDIVHLSEQGSIFLVDAIADRLFKPGSPSR
jgi:peptidoglycan/LPS O-acetylase OafA/YrhL